RGRESGSTTTAKREKSPTLERPTNIYSANTARVGVCETILGTHRFQRAEIRRRSASMERIYFVHLHAGSDAYPGHLEGHYGLSEIRRVGDCVDVAGNSPRTIDNHDAETRARVQLWRRLSSGQLQTDFRLLA